MDTYNKSKTQAPEQYRELAEKGVAQSKKAFDTVSAATGQTADVMKKCSSNALRGVQDYSNKVVEYTQANTNATFDFAQRISGVKSPSEFVETFERACPSAARNPDNPNQPAGSPWPAGIARDCGIPEDGLSQII
jgi:hypothetical protein